jgi:hypothetical protein
MGTHVNHSMSVNKIKGQRALYCDLMTESWNGGMKRRPLLGSGTVNTFPQKQVNMQQ